MKKIKLLILFGTFTLTAMAQKKSFTLDDLLPGGDTFWSMQPANMYTTWWGDRCVQLDADGCALIDPENGQTSALFSLGDLNRWAGTSETDKIRNGYYLTFPYAGQTLVFVQTKAENLLIDWKAGRVAWRQPRTEKAENADWNAASRHLAYTVGENLYVTTAEGKSIPVSANGSHDLVYGKSVHRDEFGISKGTFWSPKGNLLAFYRMDQSMVADYPQVDISTRIATLAPEKYPMAGETSHKVTVGIFNPKTEKTVWLQAGDPTDRYFTNISWSPDEKTLYMTELNRDQNHAQLVSYDAVTGKRLDLIYEETHPRYVEPMHGLSFLPWDDGKFIYQSQRDGYNHLYIFNLKEKIKATKKTAAQGATYTNYCASTPLTSGNFVVMNVLGFNAKEKTVIILSNEKNPIQANLYSVNVTTGKRKPLDAGEGVHSGTLSAGGTYILDRHTAPNVVRRIDLIGTTNGRRTQLLDAADPWADYAVPEITSGTIKAADGQTDLYYRMVKPVDFDATKKYPTVIYVYGGPHAHNVDASRNYLARGWEIYMAQKGYLIFVLDNRGSENRGLAFENCTFRHLGDVEMQDQMEGVSFLKSLPYVDASRLGIHGWSYGGFMTTNLMCSYPDVFKVGVAGGPVIDWQYYEVMYGERYMDTPQTNPEGYANCSLRGKAKNLKGRLQIITGYNDPICVQQHTLSFLRACIDAGTQPDFFTYPGQEHNMAGKDRIHLHERITRYFEDYLK